MLRHWLQLALTEGIGPILSRRLIAAAGGAEAACGAGASLLKQVEGIGASKASRIAAALRAAAGEVDAELGRAARQDVRLICPDDDFYPVLLRSISDPPVVLYVRGTLEPRDLNAVAIVGSRKCSFYGREQAERFGSLLAGAGVTVLSGGARGIDSSAHRGAMAHPQGRTIAVLGSGVDVAYPPENASLFASIAERGAVVSEFPLGTPPNKENFPRRNRVVSGMSRGVLVVEADERSGALITARLAGEDHGRTVFALPGRVDNPLSAGPHLLIRDGATLVTKLDEILEGLDPLPRDDATQAAPFPEPSDGVDKALVANTDSELVGARPTSRTPATPAREDTRAAAAPADLGLSERQLLILSGIGNDSANVDAIMERTALPAHVVLQELTLLSLKGQLRRVDGQTYARRQR